jgi:succinate dehydrogenase / fumarate reductase iron-sulfur subunit
VTWLGRKIFRRDQLDDPTTQPEPVAVGARGSGATGTGEAAAAGPLAEISTDWDAGRPTPVGPSVGADGKLEVAELLLDRSGAASPFGDDQTFPLPPERLRYQHPSDPEMDE